MTNDKVFHSVNSIGVEAWTFNGKNGPLHRENGPAIVYPSGEEHWYKYGRFHRVDGPAVTSPTGKDRWFIDNVNITAEVSKWLIETNITYPFSEEELMQFKLRFL